MHLFCCDDSRSGVRKGKHFLQLIPKTITADFPHESGAVAQLLQKSQYIAGRAAGVGFQQGISLSTETVLGQVNEQFSQGYNILFRHK